MVSVYLGGWGRLTASVGLGLYYTYHTLTVLDTISLLHIYQTIAVLGFMASTIASLRSQIPETDFSVTFSNPNAGRFSSFFEPKDRSSRSKMTVSSPNDRESGFHEPMEFPTCSYPDDANTMVTYRPSSNKYSNANHVDHRVIKKNDSRARRSSASMRQVNDRRASMNHIPRSPSPFLEVPKPRRPSSAVFGQARNSIPFGLPSFIARQVVKNQHQMASPSLDYYNQHDCKLCGCERIKLNVSGQYFEAKVGLLNKHPDTLLGNPQKRQQFYDGTRDEFFLDRHRPSFEAVFSYYQYGGRLKRPHTVPDDVFLAELLFYELEPSVIDEYKRAEGYENEEMELPSSECFRKIWILFECPETSKLAFFIALISVITTLVSIVLFCVETLPVFALTHCVLDEAPNFLDPFFIIETICTAWFTFELIIRFIVCPSKIKFWKDFKNLVDATAIVPYYVTFFNVVSTMSCASAKSSASLAFLRVIRLVRVFKLTKHSTGLQVLMRTFKASLEGLGLFLVALIVCLLLFSSAIYYAEIGNESTQIQSIPDAFWWAIITMTTVGYGDKVPLGPVGKFIGSLCALTGVLTLAIPVPIITGNFNRFYSHKTGRGRHM